VGAYHCPRPNRSIRPVEPSLLEDEHVNIALPLLLLAQSARPTTPELAPPRAPRLAAAPSASLTCLSSIKDQANAGVCLEASSVPTPGLLFPGPHLGGVNNVQSGTNSFIGGGSDNQATNGFGFGHTTVAGGQDNVASGNWSTVGGGRSNEAFYTSTTIGGGAYNAASGYYATVSGGKSNHSSWYAAIGGGTNNLAVGFRSVIGGGHSNSILDDKSDGATISGGKNNSISEAGGTTIGGGEGNAIVDDAWHATISGGRNNTATGFFAMVAGGDHNAASLYSFAAGRRAKALHTGAFVWGDSQDVDKTSSANNQFNVYASGGTRIFSNAAATTGVVLAPGGGSWSSMSDRTTKENLAPVDARDVLARVCTLPISTWNYEAQGAEVRHMGPMAQDFRAAFGLGVSEKLIDTVDPDGVALAAIQGLNEMLREKDAEVAALRESNRALAERVARLEQLAERDPTAR
jgi:hypothetical protein